LIYFKSLYFLLLENLFNGASTWTISCETKKGISELISALISNIEKEFFFHFFFTFILFYFIFYFPNEPNSRFSLQPEEGLGITNSRHRHLLQQTITFLDSYQSIFFIKKIRF